MRRAGCLLLLAIAFASQAGAQERPVPQRIPVATLIGLSPADVGSRFGGVLTPGADPPVQSAEITPQGVLTVMSGFEFAKFAPRCGPQPVARYGVSQDQPEQRASAIYDFIDGHLARVRLLRSEDDVASEVLLDPCASTAVSSGSSVADQAIFGVLAAPVIVPTAVSRAFKQAGDPARRDTINAALAEAALGAEPAGGPEKWAIRFAAVLHPLQAVGSTREYDLSLRPPSLPLTSYSSGVHVVFADRRVVKLTFITEIGLLRVCRFASSHLSCE